jgi:hypothetical protein
VTLFLEDTHDLGLQLVRQTLVRALLLAFFVGVMDIALATPPSVVILVVGRRPGSRLRDDLSVRSWSGSVGIRYVGGS